MTEAELVALLDAQRFTGRAAEQVASFIAGPVAQALKGHEAGDGAEVRV
jgi:adenylosuccinate lyase